MGLKSLEERVRSELRHLSYPLKPWVVSKKDAYNVIVVGGGQGGLAVAFGLLRERLNRVLVLDQHPKGREGPWATCARMQTLRTPKHLTGPDLNIPSLTFQAYYEARHGAKAWEILEKVPTVEWASYLKWYREVLNLPVENDAKVERIVPAEDGLLCLEVSRGGVWQALKTRRVVWATGIEGDGAWKTPELAGKLPRYLCAHTSEEISFQSLKGKRVGILGAGASAFDNAASAIEAGASEVHLFFRRAQLTTINYYRWMEFGGFLAYHADLDDAWRWRFMRYLTAPQPPTQDNLNRLRGKRNFQVHSLSPWKEVERVGEEVRVYTPEGNYTFDFLIFGTGFYVNPRNRPELEVFAGAITLWEDRYTPPPEEADPTLGKYPYLGSGFEFMGKDPYLHNIHDFTFGATPSMGLSGASISGMKYSVPRLIGAIMKSFYLEDIEYYYDSLVSYKEQEVEGVWGA